MKPNHLLRMRRSGWFDVMVFFMAIGLILGAMGLVLGFPLSVYGLFIMSVMLVMFSLIGIAMGRMTHVSMIPLAPFMMLGQVASLILMVLPIGVV